MKSGWKFGGGGMDDESGWRSWSDVEGSGRGEGRRLGGLRVSGGGIDMLRMDVESSDEDRWAGGCAT